MAVRRERVVVELQDDLTTGMARMAAATALLNRELDSLDGQNVRTARSADDVDRSISGMGSSANRTTRDLDKFTGRARLLAEVVALVAPASVGIGAVAIPALSSMASSLGFASIAAGTFAIGFQGMGDVLDAVNKARLEPTTENILAAQAALEGLTPAAQAFVQQLQGMIPELKNLRDIAAEGMFPGLGEGLEGLETALPRVERLVSAVSTAIGDIAADTGASVASGRWNEFLDFVAEEAPPALSQLADAAGNTTHALAGLWMGFDPLNDDFLGWLVEATDSFDRWANAVSETDGFAEFVDYIRDTGPEVGETLSAIANGMLQVVEASAPLAGPVLQIIESLADGIAEIADSPLGTPIFGMVAAVSALSLATRAYGAVQRSTWGSPAVGKVRAMGTALTTVTTAQQRATLSAEALAKAEAKRNATVAAGRQTLVRGAAALGGFALAGSGVADDIGLANTANFALMGTLAGGAAGAAAGGVIGLLLDASEASSRFGDSLRDVNTAARNGDIDALNSELEKAKDHLKDLQNTDGPKDFFGDAFNQLTSGSWLRAVPVIGGWADAFFDLGGGAEEAAESVENAETTLHRTQQFLQNRAAWELKLDGLEATQDGLDVAAGSAKTLHDNLVKVNEILSGRASVRGFEQAIDDFADRAKRRLDVLADIDKERMQTANELADNARGLADARADLAGADTSSERRTARERITDLQEQRTELHASSDERIADLTAQADALKYSLDVGTEAGRATEESLDSIASEAWGILQTMKDPILRAKFMDVAREEFVKAAIAAGHTREEANKLADDVKLLNTVKGAPTVGINGLPEARKQLTTFGVFLNDFLRTPRKLKISTELTKPGADGDLSDLYAQTITPADGTTVPGARLPYRDRVPALLAPGEEVVSNRNGQADRWRPFLKAINANRLANGGTVGIDWSRVQPIRMARGGTVAAQAAASFSAADLSAIATLVANSRQLYGDVHVHGDGAFRRELQNDSRMAASDGISR